MKFSHHQQSCVSLGFIETSVIFNMEPVPSYPCYLCGFLTRKPHELEEHLDTVCGGKTLLVVSEPWQRERERERERESERERLRERDSEILRGERVRETRVNSCFYIG